MGVEFVPFSSLLCNIVDNRGRTCPTAERGTPLIATNCVSNRNLYPTHKKVRFVDKATYDTWFRGHPQPGDILFVNKGTPGRVCMVTDPVDFCIAQDMVAIRADKEKVYPRFLFALLRSSQVQDQIERLHVGTLIPHFKKGDFNKLILPILDRATQEFIGDYYFHLSAKIDLNRRMNETLEVIARAIFKSWFVDFDPVRAKAEGRDPGLPKHIANLFPDRFEDSELGEIPAGWNVSPIGKAITAAGGGTPSTKEASYWVGGIYNWATPKDLSKLESPILVDTERKVTEAGLARISSGLLPPGTVLMSSRAPVGYLAISAIPTAINQGFIAMICDGLISNYYMLNWCSANMAEIRQVASGTTFAEISKRAFRPMKIIVPSVDVLRLFNRVIYPFYRAMEMRIKESYTLAALRDTLLPKLISGELRVKGAERIIGRRV